jgi:taurine dioxygenase
MPNTFTVKPLAPRFVAEVSGLPEINANPWVIKELKQLWVQYPVLVLPNQHHCIDGFVRFARQFGDFGDDPFIRPVNASKHVVEVRRDAEESTPIFGASWHSDWSFQRAPPSATLLLAKELPPIGGDTIFADCYAAYDALPQEFKASLDGLSASHSAAPSYGPDGLFADDDESRSMQIIVSESARECQSHPIVRTHPESGRRGLFINHVYTLAVDGMDQSASRVLLRKLFAHMTREEFIHRHKWQTNMLVLWDNRCVLHYADGGYEGHQRIMHRVTLAGERPH